MVYTRFNDKIKRHVHLRFVVLHGKFTNVTNRVYIS